MPSRDICELEADVLYTCKECGNKFCRDCGSVEQRLCYFCKEEEEEPYNNWEA